MATGTVYLDVDDEITSAAARIRGSEATKVALVVPYGSRIATSRMNFRLLSREAIVNNRRLSIVATDPATRALAASAGLPVFANVAEWNAAGAGGSPGDSSDASDSVRTTDAPPGEAAKPDTATAVGPNTATPAKGSRSRKKAATGPPGLDQTLGLPVAAVGPVGTASAVGSASAVADAAAAGSAATGAAGTASTAGSAAANGSPPVQGRAAATPLTATSMTFPPSPPTRAAGIPAPRNRSIPRIGTPVAAIAGALILALVVAGVGAYVFLPAAEIIVTPRQEGIGPIALAVRADPTVASPDATANVVPAQLLDVPVSVSGTFPATDKRIETESATGRVVFRSFNTGSANTIPRGSVVSTEGRITFQTTAAVTLPRAQFIPPETVVFSERTVGVVAVKAGTAGNVPVNAINVVPPREDPNLTTVRNPDATAGGTRQEFPRISQKDVDAAMASLQSQLTEAFDTEVADGAGAPANATVFAETAVLGDSTPTVDPATLVAKEQESFELGLTATGTVVAVDSSPVVKIAETRLLANVGADHRLVEGSIEIVPGDPSVSNGEVSFPVTARAARVRILDPAELLGMIKGRSVEDARSILGQFGDVELTPWPDWVSTIPGIDSRVTIEIVGQTEPAREGSPTPSGSARPPGTGDSPRTGSPSDAASPAASLAP